MRWVRRIAIGVVIVVVLAIAIVYAGSEWIIRRGHDVGLTQIALPSDPAAIAEGGRLARITGCRACHGANGGGAILVDDAMFGRLAPPALARVAARYSDAELIRAVRNGVRNDGSALFIMPTSAHAALADEDVASIVAWVRTLKPLPGDSTATTRFGPIGRALILGGALPSSVHAGPVGPSRRPADIGRYFVSVSCAGCHELHAERPSDDGKQIVPALAPIAAAYDPAAFRTLMRTGVGMTPRDLGLMREAALDGLSALSDQEIEAIQAYLRTEAETAPAE